MTRLSRREFVVGAAWLRAAGGLRQGLPGTRATARDASTAWAGWRVVALAGRGSDLDCLPADLV